MGYYFSHCPKTENLLWDVLQHTVLL